MGKSTAEVLIGTGTLYIAPEGTAFPADPSVAPDVAWVDVGYSEEGWSFNVDRTIEDVEVAEEMEPIDVQQTKRDVRIVGASAQASIENFKLAMGGGTIATAAGPPATKTYTPSGVEVLDRKALLFRGKAPSGKVRDTKVPHAISVAAVEMASKKAPDKTLLAMEWRIIKQAGENPFTMTDLT